MCRTYQLSPVCARPSIGLLEPHPGAGLDGMAESTVVTKADVAAGGHGWGSLTVRSASMPRCDRFLVWRADLPPSSTASLMPVPLSWWPRWPTRRSRFRHRSTIVLSATGSTMSSRIVKPAVSTWPGLTDIYVHTRTEVSSWLGATSAYVAARPDRFRCRLSPDFAAVGPLAQQLIEAEVEEDVFGPLRALAFCNGWVLLVGVSLTRLTLLHLAETMAGRRPFVRWLRGPDGMPRRVRVGECSEGFDRLAQVLAPVEHRIMVGDSLWRAFPASEALELAAVAIRAQPEITHCAEPGYRVC